MHNCSSSLRCCAQFCAVNSQLRAIFELLATAASALRCAVTQGGYRGELRNRMFTNEQRHVPPVALEIVLKIGDVAQMYARLMRRLLRGVSVRSCCAVLSLPPHTITTSNLRTQKLGHDSRTSTEKLIKAIRKPHTLTT